MLLSLIYLDLIFQNRVFVVFIAHVKTDIKFLYFLRSEAVAQGQHIRSCQNFTQYSFRKP